MTDSSVKRIAAALSSFNESKGVETAAEIMPHLKALVSKDISVSILKETQLGRIVNGFKNYPDETVQTLAKALIKQWKASVKSNPASQNSEGARTLRKPSSAQTKSPENRSNDFGSKVRMRYEEEKSKREERSLKVVDPLAAASAASRKRKLGGAAFGKTNGSFAKRNVSFSTEKPVAHSISKDIYSSTLTNSRSMKLSSFQSQGAPEDDLQKMYEERKKRLQLRAMQAERAKAMNANGGKSVPAFASVTEGVKRKGARGTGSGVSMKSTGKDTHATAPPISVVSRGFTRLQRPDSAEGTSPSNASTPAADGPKGKTNTVMAKGGKSIEGQRPNHALSKGAQQSSAKANVSPEAEEVRKWLTGLIVDMSRYHTEFVDQGFDSMALLETMKKQDLEKMIPKPGHNRIIYDALMQLKRSKSSKKKGHSSQGAYSAYDDEDEDSNDSFVVDDDEELSGDDYGLSISDQIRRAMGGRYRNMRHYDYSEDEDDLRDMEAGWEDIQREEKISAKIGKAEDDAELERELEEQRRLAAKKKKKTKG